MKRKYIIEAGGAGFILVILYIVMFPHFNQAQVRAQAAGLQQYISDAVKLCVRDGTLPYISKCNTIFPRSTRAHTKNGSIYSIGNYYFFEQENFENAFSELGNSPWTHSDHAFSLTQRFAQNASNVTSSLFNKSHYDDNPFVVYIIAAVGGKQEWSFAVTHGGFGADDEGYLKIHPEYLPYDVSNGISSYGEFYADTTSIWPRKKAVLVDTPPEMIE
jgi:hypothetical protein